MKNYYQILGVPKYRTEVEIKQAYRKLAMQWHPDKNKSANAQQMFIEIHEAYEILSNPNQRSLYDELLNSQNLAVPSIVINKQEKQTQYDDFVFSARKQAEKVSKMTFDSVAELFFIGVGKAKYFFLIFVIGAVGVVTLFGGFNELFIKGSMEGVFMIIFAYFILKFAYRLYKKDE